MKLSALAPVALSLALAACGGSDDDGPVVVGPDAATSIDAPVAPCTISTPTFGAKGALTATATFAADTTDPRLYKIAFTAPLETGSPTDLFFFEVFTGYAPFGTTSAPTPAIAGTYPITGNQLQYADCSVCVTLASNGTADGWEDDFMATGGTVNITQIGTAVGQNLNVTFQNLTFEQVTFSQSQSTPVGNGCVTSIASASFMGTLAAPMNKVMQGPAPLAKTRAAR